MALSPMRLAGYAIGGLLILGALYTLIFLKPERPVPKKIAVVRPARVYVVPDAGAVEIRTFPGSVEGANRVPLSFRVGGTLIELPARENMEVEQGSVLARLDPRDFQSLIDRTTGQIDEASAVLEAMEKGERDEVIRMLEAQLRAAKASADEAAAEARRYQELFDKDIISKSRLAKYVLAADVAREQHAAAVEDLERGRAGARQEDVDAQKARIRSLESELKKAKDALVDTVLKAPFTGVVTKRHLENHEEVKSGQEIVTLQSVDRVEVLTDIPEALIGLTGKDNIAKLEVSFDFHPGVVYKAEYVEMAAQADRRTSTYRLRVRLDAPSDVRVLPGMTATLAVTLLQSVERGLSGFLVPADAVFTGEDGNQNVWKVDPTTKRVSRFGVKAGEVLDGKISIQEGVNKGDMVVTAGVHQLEPDQEVRPLEQRLD